VRQCDVLIVGGGPAGSACAWKLRQQGVNVVILDRAEFPRDKVCAGWVTPPVFEALQIDLDDYSHGRVCQPFTAFAVGVMGGPALRTNYHRPVSYGVRRCEFDDYLLRRSGASLSLGTAVDSIRSDGNRWVVNESVSAPILIGAGGHFCPIARRFAIRDEHAADAIVLAQETEFLLPENARDSFPVAGECPEFTFCTDLGGYGWIVRKGNYVNIGLGREQERNLTTHVTAFLTRLRETGRLPIDLQHPMRGHAYRLRSGLSRIRLPQGVLLIGDALGLADPHSGEGIRPAIESGLLAADSILAAEGDPARVTSGAFQVRCQSRFGADSPPASGRATATGPVWKLAARCALRSRWFQRHVLLDRWFLHTQQPALKLQYTPRSPSDHATVL
jgi:menaquinone-9 beta-reductase